MNIYYENIAYVGSSFTNEKGEEIPFDCIDGNLYKLKGRVGRISCVGYVDCSHHGYSGGYYKYVFVFKDDLSIKKLGKKVFLELVELNNHKKPIPREKDEYDLLLEKYGKNFSLLDFLHTFDK